MAHYQLCIVKKATLTKNSESNTLWENNIVSQANWIGSSLRDILNFRKLHYNTNEMNQTIQRKINSLRAIGWVFELKRQKECKENLKINENSFKNPQYTKIRHVYYKVNRKASFNSSWTNFNQER